LSLLENRNMLAGGSDAGGGLGSDAKTQDMLARLESLDQEGAKATTPEAQAANVAEKCNVLEKIAESVKTPEDRAQWLRNLAESLGAAVQLGTYPGRADRLKALYERLDKEPGGKEMAAYVKFAS